MKILIALVTTALISAPAFCAQTPAPSTAAETSNPVVWSATQIYQRQAKNMVAAAEEMPPEKYSYRPSPEQMTFGRIVSHVAQSNGGLCAMLSGTAAPATVKVSDTASKADLIAALNASLDFCNTALANLQDSQLSQTITFFRGAQAPRARALLELTADLADHYSQMAAYLRSNGLLPPSAMPRK